MFGLPNYRLKSQLDQALRENEELRAWKAQHQELLDRDHLRQMELAGEIMTSVRRSGLISQSSSQMLGRMNSFEADFSRTAGDLDGIDKQIGELAQSIATTGSAINQTSAAVEEISASIARISEESTARFLEIKNLASLSKSGQEEMKSTQKVIQEVTKGIDDLLSFLQIIDDIAGKTGILSINAAIQAAHAGDIGKGFAVVAEEVRRLAESSATNAAQISKKLNGLIGAIHQAETSSRKTTQILAESEEKVAKATASFQEIEGGTRELALGSREMLEGITSLREVASNLTESSEIMARNSNAINQTIVRLRAESQTLRTGLTEVRKDGADLGGAGLTLAQTTMRLLEGARTPGAGVDPVEATILSLEHLVWVARVRGVLDGTLKLKSSEVATAGQCPLARWEEGQPALAAHHAALHDKVRGLLDLVDAGRIDEAEREFPALVALSESVVADIRGLVAQGTGQAVLIAWSKDFELGVAAMDAQHRRLVDLINRLYDALQNGKGRAVLEDVLDQLVEYTKTHFAEEETLFLSSEYPGKKGHLEQHHSFVASVDQFRADFRAGRVVMGSETLDFLKNWLLKHIQGSDRGYTSYVA